MKESINQPMRVIQTQPLRHKYMQQEEKENHEPFKAFLISS